MKKRNNLLGSLNDIPGFKSIFELVFVIIPIAFLIRTFGFGLYQVPTGSMEPTLLVGERFFADKLTYWFKKPEYGDIIAFDDPLYKYSSSWLTNLWQRYGSWKVSNWTKRLIGKPGDHLKGVIENGKPVIYRNGKKLEEPYVNTYPIVELWKFDPRDATLNNPMGIIHKTVDPSKPFNSKEQPFYLIDTNLIRRDEEGNPIVLMPFTPYRDNIDVFDVHLGDNQYWAMGDNRLGSWDSRAWGPLDGSLIHGKIVFRIWSTDSEEGWWFVDLIKHPIEFWKKIRWKRCLQLVK